MYEPPRIDADGIHVPEYVEIRDKLKSEFLRIFGTDLYLGADSQDYQMISVFADALDDAYALAIQSYNNRNPDYAMGKALDLILPLNGMRRIGASHSSVELELKGLDGTTVRAGSIAIDKNNQRWVIQEDGIINSSGKATVHARAQDIGAKKAPVGTITQIGTPTGGWVSVTNPVAATVGREVETDAELRARRSESIEKAAIGVIPALMGALYEIEGVSRAVVCENLSNNTDSRGIPAHSIAVVVEGGDKAVIAKTIYDKKSPGCGLHGNTTVPILDINEESVNVAFSRPKESVVKVKITLKALNGYSENTENSIKQAIAAYISGLKIGESLQTGLLYGIAIDKNPKDDAAVFAPVSILAGRGAATSGAEIKASYDEVFLCTAKDVQIIVT